MLQFPIDDPAHWRSRAEEARRAAMKMIDPQARKTMLVTAENCEWLAKLIEAGWRKDPERLVDLRASRPSNINRR